MKDVLLDLIMNWDHTGISIVPVCQWTMEEMDAKNVDCVGLDDKHQITTVICVTISGMFFAIPGHLPRQNSSKFTKVFLL